MVNKRKARPCHVILLILMAALLATEVPAATITVEVLQDDAMDACTLRDAITAANQNEATGGCVAGDDNNDTIVFSVSGIINLGSALPFIESGLAISGPGPADLMINGNGFGPLFRVSATDVSISGLTLTNGISSGLGGGLLVVSTGAAEVANVEFRDNAAQDGGGIANGGTLVLSDSVISNNNATGIGGGIYNSGTLTLSDIMVTGNEAGLNGGGIYNHEAGTLIMTGTVVSGNTTDGNGGGIFGVGDLAFENSIVMDNSAFDGGGVYAGISVTIDQSVVSDNTAVYGGGIFSSGTVSLEDSTVDGNTAEFGGGINARTVLLTRSTVSGNESEAAGGGVYTEESMQLVNSTMSGNTSGSGGAVYLPGGSTLTVGYSTITGNNATTEGGGIWSAGTVTLANSILSGNSNANCHHPPGSGIFISNGFNIESGDSCDLDAAGDQPNTDPMLGSLADNSGPTLTHALLAGSPALDAADPNDCPATDQRGIARPQDGDGDGAAACDVGAVERQANDLLVASLDADPDAVTVDLELVISVVIENAGPDAVDDVELTLDLPAELGFVSAAAGCSEAGGVVSCTLGTLASAASVGIEVIANAEAAGDAVINASVTGDVIEGDTDNNTAQITVAIEADDSGGSSGSGNNTGETGSSGGGSLSLASLLILILTFLFSRYRATSLRESRT